MRVTVVMGGPSAEHAISLKSGQGIVDALARRHYAAEPLVIPKTAAIEEACAFMRRHLQQRPDVVFIAVHGAFGEDGTIQQLCEEAKVAYVGSDAAASRLGMDKIASRRRFEAAGLTVPRWHSLLHTEPADALAAQLAGAGWTFPLVVKPAQQGSSIGVSLVREVGELPSAIEEAGRHGWPVLLEEFVAGRELTVGVLGEEALPIVEIRPRHAFFDFRAKYTAGETDYLVPASLPAEVAAAVQTAGLTAHQALGCRHMSRTDIILRADGRPVVLEVNTIPGFTPTSLLPKAAAQVHVSYESLCEQLVVMAHSATSPMAAH